jgi:hypothetical protein
MLSSKEVLLDDAGQGLMNFADWLQSFVTDAYAKHEQQWIPEGDTIASVDARAHVKHEGEFQRCSRADFTQVVLCTDMCFCRNGGGEVVCWYIEGPKHTSVA